MKFLVLLIVLVGCTSQKPEQEQVKPVQISEDTETTIEVWAWNVAAKALVNAVDSYKKLYPNVTVNVTEFGGGIALKQKLSVVLGSGSGIPDLIQLEDVDIPLYAETYPDYMLGLQEYMPENWSEIVDQSKVSISFDSTGKQIAIPWGSAPLVLFYRKDLFEQAGINIEDIVTYDDYIEAGKTLQEKLPEVKFLGMGYSGGFSEPLLRGLMIQQESCYLDKNGDLSAANEKGVRAATLIQRLKNENLTHNVVDWTGAIRANKQGAIASMLYGVWWGGTIKDQMSEMKGKWAIAPLPVFEEGQARTSVWGGSSMAVIHTKDPVKQGAALAFATNTLMSVDNQLVMFEKYGLLPAYLPTYEDSRFLKADPYFGVEFKEVLVDVMKQMPTSLNYTPYYPDIVIQMNAALEAILNEGKDPEQALKDAAQEAANAVGVNVNK